MTIHAQNLPLQDPAKPGQGRTESFEADKLPETWQKTGDVAIDTAGGFKGKNSIRLQRDIKDADAPVNAASAPFDVMAGLWEISFAAKSAMKSPDTSYCGVIDLELFDAAGKSIDRKNLLEISGDAAWKPVSKRIEIPAAAAKGAFKLRLEKSIGAFYVDELSAAYVAAPSTKDKRIDRVMFIASNPTGMLLPTDSREFTLRVEATKPLADAQLEATWALRDYFGAEQLLPAKVKLTKDDKPGDKGRIVYTAKVDVSAAPLEIGRYYELTADIPQINDEPYHEFSSFCILPEAATNAMKPEEVPFSGRSWENRNREHVVLSNRLGIRIIGLRADWKVEPEPIVSQLSHVELVDKVQATWMAASPNHMVESKGPNSSKLTDGVLRAMVDDYVKKYARPYPSYVSLGNEPHGEGERVIANIAAYKSTYEEFKKVAPSVFCIGTAVGPEEEYFQKGFQPYCDAYDYHTYGSYKAHRRIMARYLELFKKYGGEKPVWVTETGLNAQGMTRLAIAQELPKHFAVMFAEGVANGSWFGTCFPDPDGKIEGSNGDSFNLFRAKYRVYAPRLDAIAYYNTINSIANKKFVEEKFYDHNVYDISFRNAANKSCQILWTEKGRKDIGLPLAGVGKVKVVTLDGRWTEVDAGGKGISVSVSEDPIFVEYEGAVKLADKLDQPAVTIAQLPKSAVKGVAAQVVLSGDGEVLAPPFWTVTKTAAGSFAITPPLNSQVREGLITVKVPNGELNFRLPVSSKIASQLLPLAATPEQPAAVRLVMRNVGGESQSVAWKISLDDQAPPINGMYDETKPVTAYFAKAAEGTSQIEANSTTEIVLPITAADPLIRYRARATLKDVEGRTVTIDRFIGGFAGVIKAKATPKIDGVIDDADWQRAAVQNIDKIDQYNSFKKPNSKWDNAADLSAKVRFMWDDQNLYIAADVADDIFRNVNDTEQLWAGDGLQLLVDAARDSAEKPGKYDYVVGLGTKGPQSWCALSADSGAALGLCSDIQLAIKRDEKTGGATYEIAIPWSRVAPFKPAVGNNLGLALGINEDDGDGRNGLMSWFGNVHSKQLDSVGDLILTD